MIIYFIKVENAVIVMRVEIVWLSDHLDDLLYYE